MAVRTQNLETIAPVLATFKISQSANVDELKDSNIGEPVEITGNSEVGPLSTDGQLLGKLVALTLTDADDGERVATVQIGGVCRLAISATYPTVGDRVVGGTTGTVRQAPAIASDPAGGNIGRGTVLDVNGTSNCLVYLN